jgi:1,4-dihydroxy-2-naphthoyl-CoA synthase
MGGKTKPGGGGSTGAGTQAFCSGGDQRVRGEGGYVGEDGVPKIDNYPP